MLRAGHSKGSLQTPALSADSVFKDSAFTNAYCKKLCRSRESHSREDGASESCSHESLEHGSLASLLKLAAFDREMASSRNCFDARGFASRCMRESDRLRFPPALGRIADQRIAFRETDVCRAAGNLYKPFCKVVFAEGAPWALRQTTSAPQRKPNSNDPVSYLPVSSIQSRQASNGDFCRKHFLSESELVHGVPDGKPGGD